MKTTYSIEGMTCNGCVADVTQRLSNLNTVSNVEVSLEDKTAVITSERKPEISAIKRALPSKYTISEKNSTIFKNNDNTSENSEKSKLQQLRPLFLIIGYVSIASFLIHYRETSLDEMMLTFMGLFFVVFSFFKFLDLKGFTNSFAMYDPLAAKIKLYAWIYPFIETILGISFLYRYQLKFALIVTLVVLSATTIGVTKVLLKKSKIQCACLGTALKLPMTEATFIENAIMILMAIVMLFKL